MYPIVTNEINVVYTKRSMKVAGRKQATTNEPQPEFPQFLFHFFQMVCTRGSWCHFSLFLAISLRLFVTTKIITRKTYVKELLQSNDVHTQKNKKLMTLTGKVTYRVQQHKDNVQTHSVTQRCQVESSFQN